MNKTKVGKLVGCWIDEKVEIDDGAVTSSPEAFGDFLAWLNGQTGWRDPVYLSEWISAMDQRGFKPEQDGSDWIILGIKLKDE